MKHILSTLAVIAVTAISASAAHALPVATHDYELNGSLADSLGGPALGSDGGTLTANTYKFAANEGLRLSNGINPAGPYSIAACGGFL